MNRIETLEAIADVLRHFDAAITCNQLPRRDVIRLVNAGLAESVGPIEVMGDDDYPAEPEIYREGFRLTDAGWKALSDHDSEYAQR